MARKTEEKVSFNTRRLRKAIKAAGYDSGNSFEDAIQKHYRDQDDFNAGVSHVKISSAKKGDPITLRSAKSIASFLNVDLEYLTGEQLLPSKEASDQAMQERSQMNAQLAHSAQASRAISLAERSGWRIIPDQKVLISSFTIYDPEGNLICENQDISALDPFIEAADHLLQLEEDITYNYLGNLLK